MTTSRTAQSETAGAMNPWRRPLPYDEWIKTVGIPIHTGYYVEDLRTLEVAPWPGRDYNSAFLVLAGQEGVTEARVTELPPGKTAAPLRFGLDEAVYVVEGRGFTTVWSEKTGQKHTFEWQKHSMFLLPRNYYHQFSNAQGNQPARLLHYNYLPIAMNIVPDADFYLKNPYSAPDTANTDGDLYSEAKSILPEGGLSGVEGRVFWYGKFFPDMRAWDKLHTYNERGAGGHRVWVQFTGSPINAHMSVFPSRTYKKGHRHGPGVVIVIPAGEGYSIMWPEGGERVVIPWHEASVFVPPNRWFHQHFNVGGEPARYLAFHGPRGSGQSERVEDRMRDQIEYPNEDPFIRATFEDQLGQRGLTSKMPEECYRDVNYRWSYEQPEE